MPAGQVSRQGTSAAFLFLYLANTLSWSRMDPVGHTSTQAPQNLQPASARDSPWGVPIM